MSSKLIQIVMRDHDPEEREPIYTYCSKPRFAAGVTTLRYYPEISTYLRVQDVRSPAHLELIQTLQLIGGKETLRNFLLYRMIQSISAVL
jgi:hypothetical protein